MVDAFEDEGCRLIDRRRARAGGRIGLRAGVNGERGKAGNAFAHRPVLMFWETMASVYRTAQNRQGAARPVPENATAALWGAAAAETFSARKVLATFSAPTPSSGGSAGSRRGRPARCGRDWRTGRRRPSRGPE